GRSGNRVSDAVSALSSLVKATLNSELRVVRSSRRQKLFEHGLNLARARHQHVFIAFEAAPARQHDRLLRANSEAVYRNEPRCLLPRAALLEFALQPAPDSVPAGPPLEASPADQDRTGATRAGDDGRFHDQVEETVGRHLGSI